MKTLISLFLITLTSLTVTAQERMLTGKVRQMGGDEIPGAKITAYEAPSISTLTDAKGEYRIKVPPEVENLEVSYSGMETKIVKIGTFDIVNIMLIPANYKKWRFGGGFSLGASGFTVSSDPNIHYIDTSRTINIRNISLHLSVLYNHSKKLSAQAIFEEDINAFTYTAEDGNQKDGAIFRTVFSVPVNYNQVIGKSGNYSIFLGGGPLVNHLSYFDKISAGLRLQAGASINNYGFNSRFYLAYDYTGGKVLVNNSSEPVNFDYNSIRLGAYFYF
jgi:hypothetical protein